MGAEPTAGALIGRRYRLDELLGEGGMGSVWAATHTVMRRRVALKFIKGGADRGGVRRRRFWREASAAGRVNHPNVINVLDLFETDERSLVIVMELLEGRTLAARFRQAGALSLSEAASYLVPAVSAVGTAHTLGIVHRDLKPANIFLAGSERSPQVKVLDFGIAKLTHRSSAPAHGNVTITGSLLGTPCYMSPEQAVAQRDIDHRADVWSLGVILYEALAGARPVEGDSPAQIVARLMNDAITPIEAIVPDLPADIAELSARMLSLDRRDRPEDLREVLAILQRHTVIQAPEFGAPSSEIDESAEWASQPPPSGEAARLPDSESTPLPAQASSRPGANRDKQRSRIWIGAVLAALLAICVIAIRHGRENAVNTQQVSPVQARTADGFAARAPALAAAPAGSALAAPERKGAPVQPPAPPSSPRATRRVPAQSAASPKDTASPSPAASQRAVRIAEDGFVDDAPF